MLLKLKFKPQLNKWLSINYDLVQNALRGSHLKNIDVDLQEISSIYQNKSIENAHRKVYNKNNFLFNFIWKE